MLKWRCWIQIRSPSGSKAEGARAVKDALEREVTGSADRGGAQGRDEARKVLEGRMRGVI